MRNAAKATIGFAIAVMLVVALPAGAQSASQNLDVSADNVGIFTFTLDTSAFDFGDVDATGAVLGGTTAGVTANGRVNGDTGGQYQADGIAGWEVRSAPRRDVTIYNASTLGAATLPTNATEDQLELRIPDGSSVGWVQFTDVGAGSGDLTDLSNVGNGGNSATGTVDLRLTIDDEDATGSYQWTVTLTATGA